MKRTATSAVTLATEMTLLGAYVPTLVEVDRNGGTIEKCSQIGSGIIGLQFARCPKRANEVSLQHANQNCGRFGNLLRNIKIGVTAHPIEFFKEDRKG